MPNPANNKFMETKRKISKKPSGPTMGMSTFVANVQNQREANIYVMPSRSLTVAGGNQIGTKESNAKEPGMSAQKRIYS
jgi:hypothetical protein